MASLTPFRQLIEKAEQEGRRSSLEDRMNSSSSYLNEEDGIFDGGEEREGEDEKDAYILQGEQFVTSRLSRRYQERMDEEAYYDDDDDDDDGNDGNDENNKIDDHLKKEDDNDNDNSNEGEKKERDGMSIAKEGQENENGRTMKEEEEERTEDLFTSIKQAETIHSEKDGEEGEKGEKAKPSSIVSFFGSETRVVTPITMNLSLNLSPSKEESEAKRVKV